MNYNDSPPSLKARAAHLALALSSAAAVLTLGVSAVTAMPASAAGMASDVAAALKLRLTKTPIDAISCDTMRSQGIRSGATRRNAMRSGAMHCNAMRCDPMRSEASLSDAMVSEICPVQSGVLLGSFVASS